MKISNDHLNFFAILPHSRASFDLHYKKSSNESGAVLVAVLVISLLSMVLAITVYSINISQATSSQRQIDRIKAEQLVLGQHWRNYMSLLNTGNPIVNPLNQNFTEVHNGVTSLAKPMSITVLPQGPGQAPFLNTTTKYEIRVDY